MGADRTISIHAPRTGSDPQRSAGIRIPANFNPRSPHGERRFWYTKYGLSYMISIHAPRTGSDSGHAANAPEATDISIHAPRTGATANDGTIATATAFQSTLPARGATLKAEVASPLRAISIHAPRTGSDTSGMGRSMNSRIISIHAPRTGSDSFSCGSGSDFSIISIHAPRTGSDGEIDAQGNFIAISIHAPRTGSDAQSCAIMKRLLVISIHAPRTGSDADCQQLNAVDSSFQSTLPARGATSYQIKPGAPGNFNPRSPHGERRATTSSGFCWSNFNPRSPHGERRSVGAEVGWLVEFQSTLPARGATLLVNGLWHDQIFQSTLPARGATQSGHKRFLQSGISIHAPRTGSDPALSRTCSLAGHFNPRSPHGERLLLSGREALLDLISIHAPRTGSDVQSPENLCPSAQFQSTLPARGAT